MLYCIYINVKYLNIKNISIFIKCKINLKIIYIQIFDIIYDLNIILFYKYFKVLYCHCTKVPLNVL